MEINDPGEWVATNSVKESIIRGNVSIGGVGMIGLRISGICRHIWYLCLFHQNEFRKATFLWLSIRK